MIKATLSKRNGDHIGTRPPFLTLGTEMTTPPAVKERDALARCDIFTGLVACLYVRYLIRRRGQVFFAAARVTYSVHKSVNPCVFNERVLILILGLSKEHLINDMHFHIGTLETRIRFAALSQQSK